MTARVMSRAGVVGVAGLAVAGFVATATGPGAPDASADLAGSASLLGHANAYGDAVGLPVARAPAAESALPGRSRMPAPSQEANIPYDGRFTFVRIRTDVGGSMGGFGGFRGRRGRGQPPWAHDYPRAERNFAKILTATTFVDTYEGGSNILTFDDPALMNYPLAYVSEPGFWQMSEAEEEALRNYLLKGGFVIFDDFGGRRDLANFEAQMFRVLPDGVFRDLSDLDPLPAVFDSFFEISEPEALAPPYRGGWPQYLGIFEDNDPTKRLMLVANYNNDLGDYWEFSDSGWLPIDLTNEAYKFGVNYVIYAMTH